MGQCDHSSAECSEATRSEIYCDTGRPIMNMLIKENSGVINFDDTKLCINMMSLWAVRCVLIHTTSSLGNLSRGAANDISGLRCFSDNNLESVQLDLGAGAVDVVSGESVPDGEGVEQLDSGCLHGLQNLGEDNVD